MTDYLNEDQILLDDIPDAPPTIPAGEYHVKIVESEVRTNKDATGKYISYRSVVQSGQHAGATIFSMWSLKEKQLWRMKGDFKRLGFGTNARTLGELLAEIEAGALNGVEGIAKVSEEVRQINGQPDPDGTKQNAVRKWLSAA